MNFDINNKEEVLAGIYSLIDIVKQYGIDLVIVFYNTPENYDTLTVCKRSGYSESEEHKHGHDGELLPLLTAHYMHVFSYIAGIKDCAELL